MLGQQQNPINLLNMGYGYNQQNIPVVQQYPNPFGQNNMQSMGQYYNPYGSNYYNPYLELNRQRMIIQQQMEADKHTANCFKDLTRLVNKMNNNPYTEEEMSEMLKVYDPMIMTELSPEEKKRIEVVNKYNNMSRLSNINPEYQTQMYLNRIGQISYNYQQKYNTSTDSLYDALDEVGKYLQDNYYNEHNNKMRNFGQLYDQNKYKQLLQLHNSGSSLFPSVFNNQQKVDIGDMEISVPQGLSASKEYQEKRARFLNAVANNCGVAANG